VLKRLIGRAAVWAGRVGVARVLLYASGTVLLAALVASIGGTGGWLFPGIAAVAAITGVAAARRVFTPRPPHHRYAARPRHRGVVDRRGAGVGRGHLVQAVPVRAVTVTGADSCDTPPSGVGDVAEGSCQSKSIGQWRAPMDDNDDCVKEG
jgi:hypothetical protein